MIFPIFKNRDLTRGEKVEDRFHGAQMRHRFLSCNAFRTDSSMHDLRADVARLWILPLLTGAVRRGGDIRLFSMHASCETCHSGEMHHGKSPGRLTCSNMHAYSIRAAISDGHSGPGADGHIGG